MAGSTNKGTITLTLTVTLVGKILSFQVIYEVKLAGYFQKLNFQQNLVQMLRGSTIAALRNLLNICRKLLYQTSMRRKKKGDADQYVLLIWDVFLGQKTEVVISIQEQKILNEYAPNNMINYFQVLDLTVNKWVNDFMNQKFNEWFTTQLRNELESGKELEYTTIKFLLSTMKPLLAGWLIDCYNQLISSHGKQIILAG